MRSSFSLTCSMMTVALANALGRLMRPFASVDLVSRPIFVPFYFPQPNRSYTKEGLRASGNFPPSRAVFVCIACAAALSPPTPPPSQGGESGRRPLLFFPPCKGGTQGGVLRVPLRCAGFGIQAIEN